MTKAKTVYIKNLLGHTRTLVQHAGRAFVRFWRAKWWHRVATVLGVALILWISTMYGIAQWYIHSQHTKPLKLGVSFIPAYAESLGLDAEKTMDALIDDLGVRHFRLVSYWSQLEPVQDTYDFSLLDWQFRKAEAAGATITLSLGLRQPRWPECHMPEWASKLPNGRGVNGSWQDRLQQYIAEVVNRYKGSPSLQSYQLENEYFLKGFSEHCTDFDRQRLIDEYELVKRLDPVRPVILSRSNNLPTLVTGRPRPDVIGMSIYRRVWDTNTRRYFTYPMPAWYYASLAGAQKMLTGRESMIHEMQAEAWPPRGQGITEISLAEQNKSINAERLADRFTFAEATGMRDIYLWGGEYWYYRMVKLRDPSLWRVAHEAFAEANREELSFRAETGDVVQLASY